jgi:transposase
MCASSSTGSWYVLSTGCQWRYVPKDLPPKSTLFDYFDLWNYDGTLENIHHALYVTCREAMGREPASELFGKTEILLGLGKLQHAAIGSQTAAIEEGCDCLAPEGSYRGSWQVSTCAD